MDELVLEWSTPEFFNYAYQAAGYFMTTAAIYVMNKLATLRLWGLPLSVMTSVWLVSLASMLLGFGLVFKVFGTVFGEWLLLSGDVLLAVGLVSLSITMHKALKWVDRTFVRIACIKRKEKKHEKS